MALRTLDYRKDIILLGKTGNGKSSLGNSLLDMDVFSVSQSLKAVTLECQKMANNNICVTDTPGLLDTEHQVADLALKILSSLNECPKPHAFIIVFSALARTSHDEIRTMSLLRLIFSEKCFDHAIVVFTGYSERNSDSDFEEFWKSHDLMREFVNKCGGRACRIDNNSSERSKRVEEILFLVDEVSNKGSKRFDSHYKKMHEDVFKEQQQKNKELEKQQRDDPVTEQSFIIRFDEEVQQINKRLIFAYYNCFQNAESDVLEKDEKVKEKIILASIMVGFACVSCSVICIVGLGLVGKAAAFSLMSAQVVTGKSFAVSAATFVYSLNRSVVSFRSMLEVIDHFLKCPDSTEGNERHLDHMIDYVVSFFRKPDTP